MKSAPVWRNGKCIGGIAVLLTAVWIQVASATDATVYGNLKVNGLLFSGDTTNTLITKPSDFPFPWTISGQNIYYNGGNVGIGVLSPENKLEVSGTVKATNFVGDGSGLTGVGGFWSTSGNAGTIPGTSFIGTTDNQALEIKVNNVRAMRIEPTLNTPNIIFGSQYNYATGGGSTVSGGGFAGSNCYEPSTGLVTRQCFNLAAAGASTVSGGWSNIAYGSSSVVAGGEANTAGIVSGTKWWGTVSGGFGNAASAISSSIGGGELNNVIGDYGTISGGWRNAASALSSSIGGGKSNSVIGDYSTVSGGYSNNAKANYSTISGGDSNKTGDINGSFKAQYSTVSGGTSNSADASAATVAGGARNLANGNNAFIAGGTDNTASGQWSFAAGRRSKALNDGCFMFSDSNDFDFQCTTNNAFTTRATGGVWFVTAIDGAGAAAKLTTIDTAGNLNIDPSGAINFGANTRQMLNLWNANYGIGVQPSAMYFRSDSDFEWYKGGIHSNVFANAGGGSWLMGLSTSGLAVNSTFVSASDRNIKENFEDIDSVQILEKLASLPIQSWNYKADDNKVKHIGPMAQDFFAAFGVGPDDKHITTVDEGGIALAAIKALKAENDFLKSELTNLKARLERLELQSTGK